ncbi:hypothetical protein NDU88_010435 [Pleurodeles waltl]|uniref:Uncharacterized protein n=1 Tax=Pleurodeles waltl TaxID=8319 RepID=A0AAV7S1X3_PLEWA|nr:hypothetical protein NDU88_010435 [Pleurodeles waltl]
MQICAAERSEVERHLGCVGASHLTRAAVLSFAACRGASPLSGARSADSRARPPPVARRHQGRSTVMPRGHACVSKLQRPRRTMVTHVDCSRTLTVRVGGDPFFFSCLGLDVSGISAALCHAGFFYFFVAKCSVALCS